MARRVFISLAFFMLNAAADVRAWSVSVHTDLGSLIWNNLSRNEQRYYSELVTHLPDKGIRFESMSSWVDSQRNAPIYEVFDGQAPAALQPLANRHSANWHFENSFYFKPNQIYRCQLENNGQLRAATAALHQALIEPKSKHQEAILIAFLVHLLEDAHQPLHTGTLVKKDCSIDRGGNRYCVRKYAGSCILNLHQLWDSAFSKSRNPSFKKKKLQAQRQPMVLSVEISRILTEGERQLSLVYSVEENRAPSERYLNSAQSVVEDRLVKAATRVLTYLKHHYAKSTKH